MNTSFPTAVSGIQTVIQRQEAAAANVANVNTPGFQPYTINQVDMPSGGVRVVNITRTVNPDRGSSNTDLAVETVNQIRNKNELSANAKVIRTQNTMLGALLDIIA